MARYGAFLRGVNLGSRRRVSSGELRDCFTGLGFEDVQTFRTSGNVAFAGAGRRERITSRIETGLREMLGYDVTVFLRTAAEVRAIAAHEPFVAKDMRASQGKLQVSLLGAKPSAKARRAVLDLATQDDRLAFAARELYWLPRGGMRDSALDLKAIDGLLGPATMRTKDTMDLLAERFFGAPTGA